MTRRVIQHQAISASAGTGKTYQLAHRYIRLMANDVDPDRICALTFSRKAAGEIFESIIKYLVEASTDDGRAKHTASEINTPRFTKDGFLGLLRVFTDNLQRLHIGTLDSFIVGVVRAFSNELGVPPDFQVLDTGGPSAAELMQSVLSRIFDPHCVDRKAAEEFMEAFELATYGSEEKTFGRILSEFIVSNRRWYQLLPDETQWGNPETIWPDGTGWMHEVKDVDAAVAELDELIVSGRFSGRFETALRMVIQTAADYTESSRWDPALDRSVVFSNLVQDPGLGKRALKVKYGSSQFEFNARESGLLERILRNLISVELNRGLRQTRGIYRVLAQYEKFYDETMRRTGKLTFDDAQYLLTEGNAYSGGLVLSRKRETEGRLYIDYRLDARLDHWLIDEFQDTSDLQWASIRNLIHELVQDNSGRRSFFYVGDVKQAIHAWRGGNSDLFGQILARYGNAIGVSRLDTSYRSCRTVLDVVNKVFGGLDKKGGSPPGAADKWNAIWQEHKSHEKIADQPGFVALVEPALGEGGEKPGPDDIRRLTARVLQEIDPVRRGIEVAVLVRTNNEGRAVADYLRRECPTLPVVHEGVAAINDDMVVSLLLALVKFAGHPGDERSWRCLQMSPLSKHVADRQTACLAMLESIHRDGFRLFLKEWGKRLNSEVGLNPYGQKRLADLLDAAEDFEASGSVECSEFVRFIDEYMIHETAGSNAVRVMTVHQSKGLGFDAVILPQLMQWGSGKSGIMLGRNSENLPVWTLRMPRKAVAAQDEVLRTQLEDTANAAFFEDLCGLYVGMTRAKQALYMVTSYPGKSSKAFTAAAFLKERLLGCTNPESGPDGEIAGEQCGILYEHGDRGWFEMRRIADEQRTAEPTATLPHDFCRKQSSTRRAERIEPSGEEEIVVDAAGLFNPESADIREFGIAIHELFQKVEWIGETDVTAIIDEWQKTTSVTGRVKEDVCKQFKLCMEAEEIRGCLSRPGDNVELWREKGFETFVNGRLMAGTFDRVIIFKDEHGRAVKARIIDYKSSLVDSNDLSAMKSRSGRYAPQMKAYRDALSRILRLESESIELLLLFTRIQRAHVMQA